MTQNIVVTSVSFTATRASSDPNYIWYSVFINDDDRAYHLRFDDYHEALEELKKVHNIMAKEDIYEYNS